MRRRVKTIQDVVEWGMCIGCGACYYACKRKAVSLVNIESAGIRPKFNHELCAACTDCLSICPGHLVDASTTAQNGHLQEPAELLVGPALEVWEGYAADPELRHAASSGGALSALSLYCLEQEQMAFVLHCGMDPSKPWANVTVQSRNKKELLARTGSRYAPASPCDGLQLIEESDRPCVFIGKPCDAAALALLRKQRPRLDQNLGLVLTFFCAGTPSTKGTMDLLQSLQVEPERIDDVRYRGLGWPGRFRVLSENTTHEVSMSYEQSWDRLEKYRPFRCHLCPDGLGQVADISCGDAWHQFSNNGDPGRSIILVRTPRGRTLLHRAAAAGYLELTRSNPAAVVSAQEGLIRRRTHLFGRILAMKIMLVPTPRFVGFSLVQAWLRLPPWTKFRTLLGTAKRILWRGLWHRQSLC
jgi:coenzyme F420 hydrogenase subunit beta